MEKFRCPGCNRIRKISFEGRILGQVMDEEVRTVCVECNPFIRVKCDSCHIVTEILGRDLWKCCCGGNYRVFKKEGQADDKKTFRFH